MGRNGLRGTGKHVTLFTVRNGLLRKISPQTHLVKKPGMDLAG
jgi:hypothetical protein